MKLEIEYEEYGEALTAIASSTLALLDELNGLKYIVVHNDDGTCYKTGVFEDGEMWVAKYTEDDKEVE